MPETYSYSDEERQEAEDFNKLVDDKKISIEYASNLPKEQTPELTREIIAAAEKHIRDINAFGELAHGARRVDEDTFTDIMQNGFRTLADRYDGIEKVPQEYRFSSLYPEMVSCGMNGVGKFFKGDEGLFYNDASQYGVERPDKWQEENYGKTQFSSDAVRMTFIINPEYVRESIKYAEGLPDGERWRDRAICFVADKFYALRNNEPPEVIVEYPFFKKILDYCNKVGWLDASKAQNGFDFLQGYSSPNDDAFWGEVVISNKYKEEINQPMTDGIVINPAYSAQTIKWMNDFVMANPNKAIPIYDIYGNLLWPVKKSNEEIKRKTEEPEGQPDGLYSPEFKKLFLGRKLEEGTTFWISNKESPDFGKKTVTGIEWTDQEKAAWDKTTDDIIESIDEYEKSGINAGPAKSMGWLNHPSVGPVLALIAKSNDEICLREGIHHCSSAMKLDAEGAGKLEAISMLVNAVADKVLGGQKLVADDYKIESYPDFEKAIHDNPGLSLEDPPNIIWHYLVQFPKSKIDSFLLGVIGKPREEQRNLIYAYNEELAHAGGTQGLWLKLAKNSPV